MDFKIQSVFPLTEDMDGDPYEYRVLLHGKLKATYGDDYHDKGFDKAVGFIHGFCEAKNITFKQDWITYESIQTEHGNTW